MLIAGASILERFCLDCDGGAVADQSFVSSPLWVQFLSEVSWEGARPRGIHQATRPRRYPHEISPEKKRCFLFEKLDRP